MDVHKSLPREIENMIHDNEKERTMTEVVPNETNIFGNARNDNNIFRKTNCQRFLKTLTNYKWPKKISLCSGLT